MHLVIPFAAPLSPAGREVLRGQRWPGLQRLLAGRAAQLDSGDELSLSPPHERAVARERGWAGGDGQLPLAAHAARADGLAPQGLAWGLLTPAHWHQGTDQVSMTDPSTLALDEAASRTLFDAVAPLFVSEGFVARWGAPLRWYVAHASLATLACASPDRVIGRNVDRWLPGAREARLWRRLHSEVQMLLHGHPANAAREAQGLAVVNSVWLSGCGVEQPARGQPVQTDDRLRQAALAEDWALWAGAWKQLDADLAAAPPARLTLCGERAAASFDLGARGLWARLGALRGPARLHELLESL